MISFTFSNCFIVIIENGKEKKKQVLSLLHISGLIMHIQRLRRTCYDALIMQNAMQKPIHIYRSLYMSMHLKRTRVVLSTEDIQYRERNHNNRMQ